MKKLSVVIPTFNRKDTLRVTLAKLDAQTYPRSEYEVLVVDDGSTDGTADMVGSLIPLVSYSLRYLCQDNRGPGAAQNRGLLAARGDLVLILADDVWAVPGLLEQHVAAHARHPELHVAILGRVVQSPELPQTPFLRHWNPFPYHWVKDPENLEFYFFWGCNISVKRQFLLANGLFLEMLGPAHEDIELGYRLSRRGLRIVYNEAALGYHYHLETFESVCHRAYMRGLNWWVLAEHVHDRRLYRFCKIFSLKAGWAAAPLLAVHLARALCFNDVTVPCLVMPFLRRAEARLRDRGLAPRLYRHVIWYHFRRGIRAARRCPRAERGSRMRELLAKEAALRLNAPREA